MSFYYNSTVSLRDVHCPYCSHIQFSSKETVQCTECKKRFYGDDYLYKTPDDRNKERHEQDKELELLEDELETFYTTIKTKIQKIRKQFKPLYPLKQKEESKPETTQQTVA